MKECVGSMLLEMGIRTGGQAGFWFKNDITGLLPHESMSALTSLRYYFVDLIITSKLDSNGLL